LNKEIFSVGLKKSDWCGFSPASVGWDGGTSMTLFTAIPVHPANLTQGSKAISPKVTAATLGGALATILWTLLAAYVPAIKSIGDAGITAITGSTGTVFAFILGYLIVDPIRTATDH
jgi:hypothetical protein